MLIKAARSWPSLRQHQLQFRACDDGALAAGYSEAVTRLLADRWHTFGQFAVLARTFPAFRHWALGHIDASGSEEDLRRIVRNAADCAAAKAEAQLCHDVQHAASDALRELAPGGPSSAP